jgi:ribosomal protein S18 acetylase RimI-like enzyme
MSLCFRRAANTDIDVITDFNCRLAAETEGRILDSAVVRNGVTRGLAVGDEVRYFVAQNESGVIAQIMLTREWSDWRDGWMIWLQSGYVISTERHKGVFRELLAFAVAETSSDMEAVNVRLYVDHDNEAAKATYQRLGFHGTGYDVMEMALQPRNAPASAAAPSSDHR